MLFLLASLVLVTTIQDDSLRRFLFVCVILSILVKICKICQAKKANCIDFQFVAEPNTKIIVWVNKPLKLYTTILNSGKYSDIIYVNDTGNVTVNVIDDKNINSANSFVYYRYIMNGNKLSIIHKLPFMHTAPSSVTPPSSSMAPPSSREPEKLPLKTPSKKPFASELTTIKKIEDLTLRRTKDITKLESIVEEDSSDLDSIPDDELDKYFKTSDNLKQFTKPLEAILDDRSFAIKTDHGKTYENVYDLDEKLAKFT